MNKNLGDKILEKTKELIELMIQAGLERNETCTSISIAEFEERIHIDADDIHLVLDK